jgi:hypothetical protein
MTTLKTVVTPVGVNTSDPVLPDSGNNTAADSNTLAVDDAVKETIV